MKGKICLFIALVGLCNVYAQNNFSYPCESSDDIEECIRDYFSESGDCEKSTHEDGEPIPNQSQNAYFSKSNITVLASKANVTYINPQIRTFYINENTSNLVFAVEFDAIIMDSEYTSFRFHQVAREPIITGDAVNASYHPTIFSSLLALYLDIPTAVKEAFLTGASHFFALYLQKYFCDFGISLNSSGVGNTIGML
ncbi:hypothetical protein ABMA27_003290 [Loxostege sticticalis]|uniref:Uncharacterized protein n=1 Tax=Loxostege sticticalis TaxID=481309 RepID=A0ABR3HSL6_LOXSC